jgi:hypothetical protein
MRFLLIGISTLLSLGSGCDRETEYQVLAEFTFVNNSSRYINYSDLFILEPGDSEVISIRGESGDKISKITTCCHGFLEGYQGSYQQVYLILDSSLCVFFSENEGPTHLENFEQEVLGRNDFRYTYVFMDEQFIDAEPCN